MSKIIITVVGKDTVGIIVKVYTYLTDNQISILDIPQTIVQRPFSMMMIVDNDGAAKPFEAVSRELEQPGDEIGVEIKCQREEIFTKMRRI